MEFEYQGYWKLPSDKNLKLPGTIKFDKINGLELNVIGRFHDFKHSIGEQQYDIIQGFTSCGKSITLTNCTGWDSQRIPGIPKSKFVAQYLFVGDHYKSLEEIKIDTVSVHYLYLDEWVEIDGFQSEKYVNEKEFNIKYIQPEPIDLFENNQLKILLFFSIQGPSVGHITKENKIAQKIYLNIEFKESANLDDTIKTIKNLRNFYSFSISRLIHTTEVLIFNKDTLSKNSDTIRYLYYLDDYSPQQISSFVPDYTMLFSFQEIIGKKETIFSNWLLKYNSLSPVFNLYFDTIYNYQSHPLNKFLNYIFAIETYHRRAKGGKTFTDFDFNHIKSSLIDSLDNDNYKKWLEERIKYMNELSLRKRLNEIYDLFETIINEFEKDKKEFINKLVNTRNYYVHYDDELKNKVIKNDDFKRYNQRLKVIIQMCIMFELGFSIEEINKLIKKGISNWSVFK